METTLAHRFKNAWNSLFDKPTYNNTYNSYNGGYHRPDKNSLNSINDGTVATAVYNRIALDVAAMRMQHVVTDEYGRFKETVESGLNNCLTLEANIDQNHRSFMQDVVLSLLDEGHVAIVPIETYVDDVTGEKDILTLRTGKILEWYPDKVRVKVYNDQNGQKEELVLFKKDIAIVENPLYAVINETNATLKRLLRKINLLDVIDEQSGSGKLDLIIQLPYVIKTESKREQANARRQEIEDQLRGSKYGIAYTDGTERITQLNRPVENNLMQQITYLTGMLFSQLGITQSILDGTADEKTMINYQRRSIEPIVAAILTETNRSFLSPEKRKARHTIMVFNDPFRFVSVNEIAEIADKFTRNEIMSSNEIRQIIGMRPSDDPGADELRNKNLNSTAEPSGLQQPKDDGEEKVET